MYSVILELDVNNSSTQKYFDFAKKFKQHLLELPSCLTLLKYDGIIDEKKIVCKSFWNSLNSVKSFKKNIDYLMKETTIKDYRIRVTKEKETTIL